MPPKPRRSAPNSSGESPKDAEERKPAHDDSSLTDVGMVFLIVLTIVAAGCGMYAKTYFNDAFAIGSLETTMNRQDALGAGRKFAIDNGLRPFGENASDSQLIEVAAFKSSTDEQHFVELAAPGGLGTWKQMMKPEEHLFFSPFFWLVRLCREGDIAESKVAFTPLGELYGFVQTLPEDEPGPSIGTEEARAIAEKTLTTSPWNMPLEESYELVEESVENRVGGRADHSFTYERTGSHVDVGDGHHRLSVVVSGDRVTRVKKFIQIPEAFSRHYAETRSANDSLALFASILMFLLYIVGGGVGLFYLLKRDQVAWGPAVKCGVVMGVVAAGSSVNSLPLEWEKYDTATNATVFFFEKIVIACLTCARVSAMCILLFVASEGLGRTAFPHHPQTFAINWSSLSKAPLLRSLSIGYLGVPMFFAYSVALYSLAVSKLGWWLPSGVYEDPNVLAHYLPWYSSFAMSLMAGVIEEALFRAVPIAGMALLWKDGRGRPRTSGLIAVFILQSFIFSAAHANYPGQPFYARLFELQFVSFVFGFLYLWWGPFPGMLLHFLYDLVWMALPLFSTDSFNDKAASVVIGFTPLVLALLSVIVYGLRALPVGALNSSWVSRSTSTKKSKGHIEQTTMSTMDVVVVLLLAVVGTGVWIFLVNPGCSNAAHLRVDHESAVASARAHLSVPDDNAWKALTSTSSSTGLSHSFVWEADAHRKSCRPFDGPPTAAAVEGDREASLFADLTERGFLTTPAWEVRFVRFNGSAEERAEEYSADIADGVLAWDRDFPEALAGDNTTEATAKQVAMDAFVGQGIAAGALRFVSASQHKRPLRVDWTVMMAVGRTIQHPSWDDERGHGEARIVASVVNSTVVGIVRYIHIPEEWERKKRSSKEIVSVLRSVISQLRSAYTLAITAAALITWSGKAGWTSGTFSGGIFRTVALAHLFLVVASAALNWRDAEYKFSTAEPWMNQAGKYVGMTAVKFVRVSMGALGLTFACSLWLRRDAGNALLGVLVGLGMEGALEATSLLWRVSGPRFPSVSGMNSYVPACGAAADALSALPRALASQILMFGLITRCVSMPTSARWLYAFICATVMTIFEAESELSHVSLELLPWWFLAQALNGVFLVFITSVALRHNVGLIPIAMATGHFMGRCASINAGAVQAETTGSVLLALLVVSFGARALISQAV